MCLHVGVFCPWVWGGWESTWEQDIPVTYTRSFSPPRESVYLRMTVYDPRMSPELSQQVTALIFWPPCTVSTHAPFFFFFLSFVFDHMHKRRCGSRPRRLCMRSSSDFIQDLRGRAPSRMAIVHVVKKKKNACEYLHEGQKLEVRDL